MDVLDLVLHLLAQLLVQRTQRLVHQHEVGLEHQGARNRDALLLAARKLAGAAVAHLRQLHHLQHLGNAILDLRLRHVAHLQRECKILVDRHVREQRIVLEHHADAALVRGHVVDRLVLQVDFAVGGGLEARKHHEGGGLAGTRWAKHGQELALGNVQVEVLHDERFAVIALLHIDEANHRVACRVLGHSPVSSPCKCFMAA